MTDPAAIYAVVDKSKKKNRSPPEKDFAEATNAPVYALAETDASMVSAVPKENEVLESEYSMVSVDNMYSTLSHNIPPKATGPANVNTHQLGRTKNKVAKKIPEKMQHSLNKGTSFKTIACIFITIAVVAIILLICFAVLFAEMAKLKQTATPQQSQLTHNTSLQFQLVNERFSKFEQSIFMNMTGHQAMLTTTIGNLNVSIHEQRDMIQSINKNLSNLKVVFQNESILSFGARELLNDSIDGGLKMLHSNYTMLDQQLQSLQTNTSQLVYNTIPTLQNQTNELSRAALRGQSGNILYPASSCTALSPSSPSDYYWVRASDGSAERVYCDMTRSCGGVTGGWMRVADINTTADRCPNELETHASRCRIDTISAACSPAIVFNTVLEYSSVCGKVTAVLKGSPDGFADHGDMRMGTNTPLNGNYVDGVSITHGDLMHHIWTFAAYRESNDTPPPSYVHGDYFCDIRQNEHVIWDGACSSRSSCCSDNPWFYRQLQPTTDAIEMRVCRDEDRDDNEDIEIQTIELYIQ